MALGNGGPRGTDTAPTIIVSLHKAALYVPAKKFSVAPFTIRIQSELLRLLWLVEISTKDREGFLYVNKKMPIT